MTRAVVSVATGPFVRSLRRLDRSLDRVGFEGARIYWEGGVLPPGCPPHESVPFAFKPYALVEARSRGLTELLWLDSTCVAVRPLDPMFELIARRGYALFRNGRRIAGEWAGDETLRRLGIDRETTMAIPEVNACALGIDASHEVGAAFLRRWYEAACDGAAFRGVADGIRSEEDYEAVRSNLRARCSVDDRVRGHRHDQSVAGILAYQLHMELTDHGLRPFRRNRGPILPTTVIVNGRPVGRFERPIAISLGRTAGRARASVRRVRSRYPGDG